MECFLSWFINNFLELLVAGGTLGAAWFAYRSAKMSEMANKAQFSPLIIPLCFSYISTQFNFTIKNNINYHNAFAKNIMIYIDGKKRFELQTLDPEDEYSFSIRNIEINQVLSKDIEIKYEDLFGNQFETTCKLSNQLEKESDISSNATVIKFSWKYKQK